MAYIQQRGERKFKITVCNGYRPNGQKRMQARTIDVPKDLPKKNIKQYVYVEAERLEKRFRSGIDMDERTTFEQYATTWLARQTRYKASTLGGYRRMLETVYPFIGGIPLCKLRPMNLEELCAELRKRTGRNGKPLSECTVHKYLDCVSAVLEDARKNDILLYNPAHRVQLPHFERPRQRIPQPYEMQVLLNAIWEEPTLYSVYYLLAICTGLRRGELCALRWDDVQDNNRLLVRRSRGSVPGQGVQESDTKNHRDRVVVLPQIAYDALGSLMTENICAGQVPLMGDYIFRTAKGPIDPNTFTRRLRRIYKRCNLSQDYHLHTLRHYFATYLLQQGTSKQVAADLLGHGDTAFLERTYCHPQDTCKEEAAGLLDSLLTPMEDHEWTPPPADDGKINHHPKACHKRRTRGTAKTI